MSQDKQPSVVAERLSHAYGEGAARTPVLHELSLKFWPGELTLVMGASGSGKSTLLATLSGLLRPQGGTVQALETPIWNLGPRELERFRFQHCGFVFQNFNLFPALTALEQVALPLRFGGVAEAAAQKRALAALDEVGLSPRLKLRPAQLSGGEKQRVAIARALVGSPQLLFADEPTSALDSTNSEIVIDLLERIALNHGATVIAVTHDPRLALHAERIIRLQDGAVLEDARTLSVTSGSLTPGGYGPLTHISTTPTGSHF